MNKNLKSIIYLIGIVLIVLFVIIVMTSVNNKKRREEDKLYSTFNQVIKDYYKDYYYKVVLNNNSSNAEDIKTTGIKISLRDLAKYKGTDEDSILSQFKNYQNNQPCDYDNTKAIIYPVHPYGSEDIRIESTVVCGIK